MRTQTTLIKKQGSEGLAIVKFFPENQEEVLMLIRYYNAEYKDDQEKNYLDGLIQHGVASLKQGYTALEAQVTNTRGETMVKVTKEFR